MDIFVINSGQEISSKNKNVRDLIHGLNFSGVFCEHLKSLTPPPLQIGH